MITSVTQERSRLAVWIVKHASKALLSPFFKINIRGTHNIPEKGSFVLLPKHQRWEDIPLIAISIKRPLYYVAKQELFNNSISKRLITMLGGLSLNRQNPARSRGTYSTVLQKLAKEEGVVIFPEGTYFKDRMGPGQIGLIRLVFSNINTLFIPAGIQYTHGKGRVKVQISIGEPVKADNFGSVEELFNFAMHEIADLSGCRGS